MTDYQATTGNQTNSETQAIPRPRHSHWRWTLPLGIVLGILTIGAVSIVCVALMPKYKATALIQMSSVAPVLLFAEDHSRWQRSFCTAGCSCTALYDRFVNTQMAIMRSPAVINRALASTEVARTPIVQRQRDQREWIVRNLQMRRDGNSEVLIVSFTANTPGVSEVIVNAVVHAYFEHIATATRGIDSNIVMSLVAERRRHQSVADQLRQSIVETREHEAREQEDMAAVQLADRLAFLQNELRRSERIMDMIDDRVIAIQAEQRAPSRIQLLSHAVSTRR